MDVLTELLLYICGIVDVLHRPVFSPYETKLEIGKTRPEKRCVFRPANSCFRMCSHGQKQSKKHLKTIKKYFFSS